MPSYLNQDHFWRDLLLFPLLCTCQRVCELFNFKWFGRGDLASYHFLGPSAPFVPPQTNPPPYSARKIFSTGINHQTTHQTLLAASTHQTRPPRNLLVTQTSASSCLKDYHTGHFVPQTFTGWFGLACLYFSQTEGTGFVVSTCLAERNNLEMTAARLKPRIKQEELWSQNIELFTQKGFRRVGGWRPLHSQELLTFFPHQRRCVNVLCQVHLSIQYFQQWENPSTSKCSHRGSRILSVTESFLAALPLKLTNSKWQFQQFYTGSSNVQVALAVHFHFVWPSLILI